MSEIRFKYDGFYHNADWQSYKVQKRSDCLECEGGWQDTGQELLLRTEYDDTNRTVKITDVRLGPLEQDDEV
jgi:hypothetical protein